MNFVKNADFVPASPQKREPDPAFMRRALHYASLAAARGDVPVGAVVVKDGAVVSYGYNDRERKRNTIRHAEMTAIDRACRKLGGWRLTGCDIYVTLEPCVMCTGAILNSRVENVFFGARDPHGGALLKLLADPASPPFVTPDVLADECAAALRAFFRELRKK